MGTPSGQPRMRIRLAPEVEQAVSYLVSRDHRGRRRRNGEPPLDNWSWAHVASGAGLGVLGLSWASAFVTLVAFEGLEALLRRIPTKDASGLFEYESWPNIVGDVVTGMVGFALARLTLGKPIARAALAALLPLRSAVGKR